MCSTREGRLAEIAKAIDEVAANAGVAGKPDLGDLDDRLSGIWAMVAELDPALTARLRSYCPDGE